MLHEASRRRAEIIRGVKSVQYKLPSLMLTPAVYYRRPNLEQVFVLDWNKGMRFGIVTKAEPDPVWRNMCVSYSTCCPCSLKNCSA